MSGQAGPAPGAATPGGANRLQWPDAGWLAAALVAILLPVGATAAWLRPTYGASAAEAQLGIWLLKLALIGVAGAGLALRPVRGGSVEAMGAAHPASAGVLPGWPLTVIIALAAALRAMHLDTELWLDEIEMLVRYVPLEWRQLVSTYDSQNHHPLYTLMARGAWLLAGGADWSVRMPAALFGVGSVIAMERFGRRLVSATEATLAALVLAVSYHHVWFSQNARGYTVILMLVILATASFLDLMDPRSPGSRRKLAWRYGLLMALATWTHLTAALVAVGHALALAIATRWRSSEGRAASRWPAAGLALGALLSFTLYAPMLPQVVREVTAPSLGGVEVEWTSARWMLSEGARALSGGIPGGLPALLAALAILAIGVASLWRRARAAAMALFFPVAVTGAALVATGHNLWPRFFFFAAGFIVLAAVRGGFALVERLVPWQPRRVAVAGALAVALLSLGTVPRAWQPKQQFRAALAWVDSRRAPGDVAVALDLVWHVYLLRDWAADWELVREPARLAEVEGRSARTWIVYTLPTRLRALHPSLWAAIAPPRYEEVRVFPATVGGGEIHVLRRQQSTGHD